LLDLDEANSRFAAIGELFTFKNGFELAPDAAAEPPSAATLEIPPSLQARIQIEPDLAGNHLSRAQLYDQAHDFESARNELLEAIRLEPDYERPHVQLTTLYISHQDLAGAVAELREVVRIAPFGMIEGTALARTLETAGKTPDAVAEYRAVLARYPGDIDIDKALVDLYVTQKDFNSAIEELRRSLKSNSLSPEDEAKFVDQRWDDQTRLARLLKINGDLDGAAERYVYLLRFKPDDPELHNDYGMILSDQHRCGEAIAEFNESIRLSDNGTDTSYPRSNVAQCLVIQKDYAAATKELKSILGSAPNSPIAENNVAWIYATSDDPKIKNPAEALRLARLAVDSSPQPEPYMLDTLAEALLLNGKADEALAIEQKAVALDPSDAEFQSRLKHFQDAAKKSSSSQPVAAVAP